MELTDADRDAIGRLGAASTAERAEAVWQLYERWSGYAARRARGLLRHAADVEDPEAIAHEVWLRLVGKVARGPLDLQPPHDKTFPAYLRSAVASAFFDLLRKRRGRPGVGELLRRLQRRTTADAGGWSADLRTQLLQEMIDLHRGGGDWDDVEALSRVTGLDRQRVEDFIVRVVDPVLGAGVALSVETVVVDEAPDPGQNELRARLFERVGGLFKPGSKGHAVAIAILSVSLTQDAFKRKETTRGEGDPMALDQDLLADELQAMGRPWKSCGGAHDAGRPALGCARCRNALSQWRTRAFQAFRKDPAFRDLLTALCQEDPGASVFLRHAVQDFVRTRWDQDEGRS